jgi:hypothetical protein
VYSRREQPHESVSTLLNCGECSSVFPDANLLAFCPVEHSSETTMPSRPEGDFFGALLRLAWQSVGESVNDVVQVRFRFALLCDLAPFLLCGFALGCH